MSTTAATAAAATAATKTKTAVLKMEEVIERVGEVGTFSPKLGEILTFLLAETRNIRQEDDVFYICAADFSLLNLPKGKSLGRSKPATNS